MAAEGFTCRTARAGDLRALVSLLADDVLGQTREDFRDPLPAAYAAAFDEILTSGLTRILVIEEAGEIIGCLHLTLIPHLSFIGQRRAIFESVRVRSSHRGRGAGAELVRYAIAEARAAGCGQIVLTTDATRADAHRFWRRAGFTASHVGMKMHLKPENG